MRNRFHGVSTPLLLAATAVLAIAIGAAVALAISSDDDSTDNGDATPTATRPTATATTAPASPTPVEPTATIAAAETWSIEFQRTGGFAGLSQRVGISSDGQATYEDMRTQRVETGTIGAAGLAELRALIDSSGFFTQPTPQEAPCADCFNLSISVAVDGQSHTVEAVDIGLDAALVPFVDRLTALLQDGLSQ